jgi:pseudaminic acid cytidylyltransferase
VAPLDSVIVIPARGGSQRIPNKNIREIAGVPVLARTIAIARDSGVSNTILVSTDSSEIAGLAASLGVEVVDRPVHLADHHTPLLPVIQHAITTLETQGRAVQSTAIACLYATAVTLDPEDFSGAYRQLISRGAHENEEKFVIGISEYSHPIQRALGMDSDHRLRAISPEFANTRTQDLPSRYFDAGAFIWGLLPFWKDSEPILTRSMGYLLPSWRAVDLDTESDWARAELVVHELDAQQR